jgi:hypothetical protein
VDELDIANKSLAKVLEGMMTKLEELEAGDSRLDHQSFMDELIEVGSDYRLCVMCRELIWVQDDQFVKSRLERILKERSSSLSHLETEIKSVVAVIQKS